MAQNKLQRRAPRGTGDIEGFGGRIGFPQYAHVVATNHEGVAQQEGIMHCDTGGNEHQPSARQDQRTTHHEGNECYEERRRAQRYCKSS